eukprot:scaffold9338_cov113-Isochrysis_galbana.AAC.10
MSASLSTSLRADYGGACVVRVVVVKHELVVRLECDPVLALQHVEQVGDLVVVLGCCGLLDLGGLLLLPRALLGLLVQVVGHVADVRARVRLDDRLDIAVTLLHLHKRQNLPRLTLTRRGARRNRPRKYLSTC